MKINKILIAITAMLLVLIAGCSNNVKIYGNKIVVEKQVNDINEYEFYKEIDDKNEIENAINILKYINWKMQKYIWYILLIINFILKTLIIKQAVPFMNYRLVLIKIK